MARWGAPFAAALVADPRGERAQPRVSAPRGAYTSRLTAHLRQQLDLALAATGTDLQTRVDRTGHGLSALVVLQVPVAPTLSVDLGAELRRAGHGAAPLTQLPLSLGLGFHTPDSVHISLGAALGPTRAVHAHWRDPLPTQADRWSLGFGAFLRVSAPLPP